MFVPFSTDRV